jgi:peptide chain release factor subunit 1
MKKELTTASNIKNRKNRSNVERVLKMIIEKLKTLNNSENINGTLIFSGINKDGFEILEIFYPEIPSNLSYYRCDNKFHTYLVTDKFQKDEKSILLVLIYGDNYIISEHSLNFSKLIDSSSNRLIKRQRKGGQSSIRFSRLAEESRQFYIEKIKDKIHSIILENKIPIVIDGSSELSEFLYSELKEPVKIIKSNSFNNQNIEKLNQIDTKLLKNIIINIYENREQELKKVSEDFLRFSENYLVGFEEIKENLENVEKIYIIEGIKIDNINFLSDKMINIPFKSSSFSFFKDIGGIIAKKYY